MRDNRWFVPQNRDSQIRASAPFFIVQDLLASVDYYHQSLGFSKPKLWGDPPHFAMPSRDGSIVMLRQVMEGMTILPNGSQKGCWDAYFWVDGLEGLFAEMKANGAQFEYEICEQHDYDMKEFAVRDPDGYILAFGEDINAAS